MERIPKPGEFYRHFKNKLYQIVAVAEHTETGEQMVVYQALYGDFRTYVRPLAMFVSEVDREKYPEADQKYRFERVAFKAKNGAGEGPGGSGQAESAPSVSSAKAPSSGGDSAPEPNPYLMRFLEAEGIEKQLECLQAMEGKVRQEELDIIYVVLDIQPETGTVIEQLRGIQKLLRTRGRFDGTRLRP